MRRAPVLLFVAALCLLGAPTARAATTVIITISTNSPSPNPANIKAGDTIVWHNNDVAAHKIFAEGALIATAPANGDSELAGPFAAGTYDYQIRDANGVAELGSGQIIASDATTTTSSTTTTTRPTTTSSTTTSTSTSTTTTSTSTTTTTTTSTVPSSASGPVTIQDKGGSGGGSSTLPLLLGALVVVVGLAGLAYWLWWRSGIPYEDDGPDWTQEPPPTVQGPRI